MKPSLIAPMLALSLALSLASAGAQEQTPATPPAAKGATATDVKPSPKRKPLRRRSVQQVIEPTPRIASDAYRPTLTARPPTARAAPGQPETAPRMNTCDAGGCFDTNGARYNGVGPAVLGPQGRLCTRGAVTTECF